MTILDKYVLSQTMRRLFIALSIVLLTLILERVLRLFEFAAANNAAFGLVLQMAANLLPHYLGLALPAAFFISILLLMAQLGDNNELDVILGSGSSVKRMARTIIIIGVIFSGLSVLLLGYLQPYSRYGYRAIRHAATHAVWNEVITAQTFFAPVKGLTILANEIDLDGRSLSGIFVHQIEDDGPEMTITAGKGQVTTDIKTGDTEIVLQNVVQIIERPGQSPYALFLGKLVFKPDFPFKPAPFRERGNDQREMTLGEIWRSNNRKKISDSTEKNKMTAEVNGRLVRSFSVATMPFLAVPMGIAAKRRRRGPAVATAAILLLLYHYSLEIGEGLVGIGAVSPFIGLWVPFSLFSFFCINMFLRIDQRLRPNRFEQLFDRLDNGIQTIKRNILLRGKPKQ